MLQEVSGEAFQFSEDDSKPVKTQGTKDEGPVRRAVPVRCCNLGIIVCVHTRVCGRYMLQSGYDCVCARVRVRVYVMYDCMHVCSFKIYVYTDIHTHTYIHRHTSISAHIHT